MKKITKSFIYFIGVITLILIGINILYGIYLFVTSPYARNKIIWFIDESLQNKFSTQADLSKNKKVMTDFQFVEDCQTGYDKFVGYDKRVDGKEYLRIVCEDIPLPNTDFDALIILEERKEIYSVDISHVDHWNILVHRTIMDKDPEQVIPKFDTLKVEKGTGRILAFKNNELVQIGTPFLRGNIYGIDWKDTE